MEPCALHILVKRSAWCVHERISRIFLTEHMTLATQDVRGGSTESRGALPTPQARDQIVL